MSKPGRGQFLVGDKFVETASDSESENILKYMDSTTSQQFDDDEEAPEESDDDEC